MVRVSFGPTFVANPPPPQARHRSCSGPQTQTPMRATTGLLLLLILPFLGIATAQNTVESVPARWGQASALVGSLFVVQGGKTQGMGGGGYTYSSAPSDGEMYVLDLASSFSLSEPPWQSVVPQASGAKAPAVSFHTISPLNSTSLLLFGGDGAPVVPVQTGNDSAYIVHLGGSSTNRTVEYQPVPSSWNQPMRRMYHTSESNAHGSVYIVGGERADGSGIIFDQEWTIDVEAAASPSFQLVPNSPPGSLVGSTSTLLSDGTLLLLGGVDAMGGLQSMQNLFAYSSKSNVWTQTTTQAFENVNVTGRAPAFPPPRRDHIAVSLPNQRVFIQGGASADLSTVYSDAWILDWSVNPPVWTMVDSTAGPGPRYGHSAVAYGREVLISFGWAGGNAAPTGAYVFDASTLASSTSVKGGWTGGSWSATTYTPDPQMAQPAASTGSSSGSSSGGNGSSSSSGGSSTSGSSSGGGGSTSSDGGTSGDGGDASSGAPATFPTGDATHGDNGSANTDSSSASDGAKAGAAIGALVGAGLVVGAGYAAYRRRSLNNYRRYGDGSVGLLGFRRVGGGGGGDDDDGLLMEKGYMQSEYDRPYHRTDGGAAPLLTGGLAAYGRKRGRNEGSPWTAGNVGHAMEGSGPHFRERIAILAGRGKRDTHTAPRFDMLADEADANSLFRPLHEPAPHHHHHLYDNMHDPQLAAAAAYDDDEAMISPVWQHEGQLREHTYVHVDGEDDLSSGDLGRFQQQQQHHHHEEAAVQQDYHDELEMYSPFEDRPEQRAAAAAAAARTSILFGVGVAAGAGAGGGAASHGYGRLADREYDYEYVYEQDIERARSDYARSELDTQEEEGEDGGVGGGGVFSSGPSLQSHSTMRSGPSSNSTKSSSYDVLSTATGGGGMVSFSDASHGRQGNGNGGMKRSPTWWDRFVGHSILERTASGRFLTGPNANLPIRDPAPPPAVSNLQPITESPRSRDVSEARAHPSAAVQDPFADTHAAAAAAAANVFVVAEGMDEMGRRRHRDGSELGGGGVGAEAPYHEQGRSISSIGSARTGASSHFESRLRGMDVVQRVGTGSSRHTHSTRRGGGGGGGGGGSSIMGSDTDSEPALSRAPTLLRLRPRNVASSDVLTEAGEEVEGEQEELQVQVKEKEEEEVEETPGSIVWNPARDWSAPSPQASSSATTATKLSPSPSSSNQAHRRASNVSETPSLTPLTTKRARQNPIMISPLFPSTTSPFYVAANAALKTPHTGSASSSAGAGAKSVREKVEAFESHARSQPHSAGVGGGAGTPTSIWSATLSSASSTIQAKLKDGDGENGAGGCKPDGSGSAAEGRGKKKKKSNPHPHARTRSHSHYTTTTHGLAPKPQLFVANPE